MGDIARQLEINIMAVLNRKTHGIPKGAVYIGRGSKWGNPFVMGTHGDRDSVCTQYEQHLNAQVLNGEVTKQELASLHGKDLVCYCAPLNCHGHVLERAAAWASAELEKPAQKEFNLIVAGGRDFDNAAWLSEEIFKIADQELSEYSVNLVSGMARGADALGYEFAQQHNVVCNTFPADWATYGKRAGFLRNEAMGKFADGLLAFWDGKSSGTRHMIEFMQSLGKFVKVIHYSVGTTAELPTIDLKKDVTWARKGGYECSSKGDKRFSALFAVMPDGRTIEQHYQCDVKGYQPGGTNWHMGKGKPPLDKTKDMWKEYLNLWEIWAAHNPQLIQQLAVKAKEFGYVLTDMFATTPVNQARALAEILNNYR